MDFDDAAMNQAIRRLGIAFSALIEAAHSLVDQQA
jgi:hypothetical protein